MDTGVLKKLIAPSIQDVQHKSRTCIGPPYPNGSSNYFGIIAQHNSRPIREFKANSTIVVLKFDKLVFPIIRIL